MAGSVTNFRIAGDRTPKYALLRPLLAGLASRQRVYRVTHTGSVENFAELEFLSGGATLERRGSTARLYEGLPPYMAFSAPSGFLGRQVAHAAASDLQFPDSLKDWNDDHRVAWLFTRGMNLSGNLVFGDAPLHLEMAFRQVRAIPASAKLTHYVTMAMVLKGAAYGSSAGGEQPKFLAITKDTGHVIVKFAKKGTRMADLLPLEHLALNALAESHVPAARSQLLASGTHVFLEIERFDRSAAHGRIGMLSAGAVDDELFGQRDTWPQFAARCVQSKRLAPEDARHIDTMAAFSELIGNTDRHFENISVLLNEAGEFASVAPAYDILPMRYAPIGGGVDPALVPIEPKVGTIGAKPEVWARAAEAADRFWSAVQTAQLAAPISRKMRSIAAANLAVARRFAAPLLPAATLTATSAPSRATPRPQPRSQSARARTSRSSRSS
jgi:hypothetical protein